MCRLLGTRAGLNDREALGKVVTTRPTKDLAQLCSLPHALVSTLQKHRSKMSKLIRFGILHFRNNWGWPCTAVRMWLMCWNRKLYRQKQYYCYRDATQQPIYVIDSLTIFTSQIVHIHACWGKICLHSLADQNAHRLEKMFSTKYQAKATWTTKKVLR